MLFDTPSYLEPLTIIRVGSAAIPALGAYAPDTRTVYLDPAVDIRVGDVVELRGETRRVAAVPQRWVGAGVTAVLEEIGGVLVEQGTLTRPTGGGFNRTTRAFDQPVLVPVWSGSCRVDPVDQGGDQDIAEQVVTTQQLRVKLPVEVTDVQPDDVFTLTTALDPRLTGRPLTVTRVEGVADGLRVLRVIDNQG